MKHPIQPLEKDDHGTLWFKKNAIVIYLVDNGPFDLNDLAMQGFSQEDHIQFAQLIGYSLGGFSELSYVDDETYGAAENMSSGMVEAEARNEVLREQIDQAREGTKIAATALFKMHPDDFEV